MPEVLVPSRTEAGRHHRVLVGIDGNTSCTCPGGQNHGRCWAQEQVKREMADNPQALVPIKVTPPTALVPRKDDLMAIAELARSIMPARGQAFPKELDTPAKVYAVMAFGLDIGVRPMTALRSIFLVNGRPEPSAQLMAGIVMAHEPDASIEIVELDDEKCTMRMVRPSRGLNVEYTYKLEDAKHAGLVKNSNPWGLYPRDMMRHACVKRLCRAYAPDLINGIDGAPLGVDEAADPTHRFIDIALSEAAEAAEAAVDEVTGEVTESEQASATAAPADVAEGDFTEDEPDAPQPDAPQGEQPDDADPGLTALMDAHNFLRDSARAAKVTADQVWQAMGLAGPRALAANAIAEDLPAHKERWQQVIAWLAEHPDKGIADVIKAQQKRAAATVEA